MEIKELHYTAPGTVAYLNVQKRVSWSAVWAGAFVTLAAMLLLRAWGFAMGVSPAPPAGIVRDLSAGLAFWWLFSGPICFYAGGWVAGRSNGIPRVSDSVIHGAIAWALASAALALWWPAMGSMAVRASAGGGTWFYAFCIMGLEVAASCIGAAQGTRLLVASDIVSHETATSHQATRTIHP